jgi:glycosyltransferase involved in cell wall biosynthesis
MEMMALGKIVLVSRQGGQSEIVEDGTDGYIFDHSIPGDFAKKLLAILNLEIDEKRGIAKNAKLKIATLYNYNCIFTQKNTLLKRLCSVKGDRTAADFPFVRPLEAGHSNPISFPSLKPDGLLSVVIPFFNMGKYINEAVNSVKASEYKNIEIIIVNDGSTEMESLVRLNTLRDQSDIKVIDTCNNGLANARNTGAELSSGEYLAFLDADDMVHPGYYSRAVKILYQYRNVDFIGCWTEYFENSTRKWPAFIPEPPLILYHNLVNSSALVYKKQSFLTSGKNDPEMPFTGLEDYDSVISMISQNKGGLIIPELLFKYRVRHESMFRNLSREKKILLHQYIANKHRSVYSRYANELIGFLSANGPGILMDNPSLDFHLEDKLPWKGPLAKRVVSIIKGNKYASSAAYKLYRFLKK